MKLKKGFLVLAILIIIALIGILVFGYYQKFFNKPQNPIVTMEVEEYGTIKIELYPEIAPNTVSNFVRLSNNGFYDGLTFHRIVKDFMIQGGDKAGDGTGSPTLSDIKDDVEKDSDADKKYTIKGEFASNGYENNKLKFTEGVLAMARSTENDSAGSQFFITTEDSASLNGEYCAFGKVIEGMEVVEKIANAEIKEADEETTSYYYIEQSTPVNPPKIANIRVETYGTDYGIPEIIEK